jgi:hypothetical protein
MVRILSDIYWKIVAAIILIEANAPAVEGAKRRRYTRGHEEWFLELERAEQKKMQKGGNLKFYEIIEIQFH